MFNFVAGVRPLSPAATSQHSSLSSQHLLAQAQAHQAMSNLEEAQKWYLEAIEKAKAEHERNPTDLQAKQAFDAIRDKYHVFLQELPLRGHQEKRAVAPLEGQISTSRPQNPVPVSTAGDASLSVPSAAQSEQVDHLFEKALSTFERLEVLNKVSLFLVYAHDNSNYGQAKASIVKYLIKKLSDIRVNLYSDQTPIGQPAISTESFGSVQQLEDILTSQLCLLPTQLIDGVVPVDKVVVCCSEVLGNYLKWPDYKKFYQALREAYFKDQQSYRTDGTQASASAIREVVRQFSQEPEYKAGFHHVLTEIAFLQIREEYLKDRHGIISIPLTPESHASCLAHFISETAVRIEDIPRFEVQAQTGREAYPNQRLHLVLFKLIERLLGESRETKLFLDKFWDGYNDLISRLQNKPSTLEWSEFVKLLDGIFDDIWMKQLREQAQYLSQMRMQHKEIIQKLLPPRLSSADLHEALYKHYQLSNLSIQRISGEHASLDDCYINLAIVESHAQREKDQATLKQQATAVHRLPSGEQLEATNLNKLITLGALFEPQQLRDGTIDMPKRIFIQGRAGIGKTTLCKKFVYDYQHNATWQDRFESVVWLPLRQLKTLHLYTLEKLLCEHYFASAGGRKAQELAQSVLDHKDTTLFILDGLDEVINELHPSRPLSRLLKELLNKPQVIITSRPAGVDPELCGPLDLELETVGFSSEDVQTYIHKFAPASNQAAIQQLIDRTPLIQDLVNIPIQLDALCYSSDRLPTDQDAMTMTMLYEAMVDKLWRKDSVRLEKKEEGEVVDPAVIATLLESDVEALMSAELQYLGYVAFKGLEDSIKIEFSVRELNQYRGAFNITALAGTKLPLRFTTDLKKTSYLHTLDVERSESKRSYHFIHLTFQEFFAAKFLAHHLQAYSQAPGMSGLVLSSAQLHTFIVAHKYDPRYEVVWLFTAGLLKGTGLEHFFTELEAVPRDLIGGRHQQLVMGCLSEARPQLNKTTIKKLESALMQWVDFELKCSGSGVSELGRQKAFPECLLLASLDQRASNKKQIIQTLGARFTLSDGALLALINALRDENNFIGNAAAMVLIMQKTLTDSTISALNQALQGSNEQIRSTVAWVIEAHKNPPEAAISSLLYDLRDEDKDVRGAAAKALGEQEMLLEVAISALINALQDEEKDIRVVAAEVLGKQETLPEAAIAALTRALQDDDKDFRYRVAEALGQQKTLPETTITTLTHALQDDYKNVRGRAAQALAKQRTLPEMSITALTNTLQDGEWDVRAAAALALDKQGTLPETAIIALTNILQDNYKIVRSLAAKVLSQQKKLPKTTIAALTQALQDNDKEVRFLASMALAQQEILPETAIAPLTNALQGDDKNVRHFAAAALFTQETLPEAAITALTNALQDEEKEVRHWATRALDKQKTLSEMTIAPLINTLQNNDEDVRDEAADALGGRETLPETAISALIDALQDNDEDVRYWAVHALGKRKKLPEVVIAFLINALQDDDKDVLCAAALALGKQETLPKTAVAALTYTLQDDDEIIRLAATQALGKQKALPETAIAALTYALQDDDEIIRLAAAQALGNQKILPETAISALIHALQDDDRNVRSTATQALFKQETLLETTISALIHALQDNDKNVRFWAAHALGKRKKLPEVAIAVLINVLQDDYKNVRSAATQALFKQETLPETAISALTHALQDNDENVRSWAARALGKQKTLPETAIAALINALQDVHKGIRSWAANALGRRETLSETAIAALTNALQDGERDVRAEAALVLGKQGTLPETAIAALIHMLQDKNEDVKSATADALGAQKILPANVISALIFAIQNENKKVSAAATRALGRHLDQLYTLLPSLAFNQIQTLYTRVFFPRSCRQIAPLYIQDYQLYFYTEAGMGRPVSLTFEQRTMLIKAFESARKEVQIAPLPEEMEVLIEGLGC